MSRIDKEQHRMTPQESYEAIENRDAFFDITSSELDTEKESIESYIENNAPTVIDKIIQKIKSNTDFREQCIQTWSENDNESGRRMATGFTEFDDKHVYDCVIQRIPELKPFVHIGIYSKQYLEDRQKYIKSIFTKEDGMTADEVSKDIPNLPVVQFLPVKTDFNVRKTTDRLGTKIDNNIRKLVQILNSIGLRTTTSCGGHSDEGRKPYLEFSGDNFEKIVSLFIEWKKAGGMEYKIFTISIDAEGFRLEPPESSGVAESIEDIRRMTEWLKRKVEEEKRKAGIGIGNKIRSGLGKIFNFIK